MYFGIRYWERGVSKLRFFSHACAVSALSACIGKRISRSILIHDSLAIKVLFLKLIGEVAVFSSKRWDRRNSYALIESATPCHDAQGYWWDLNPVRLTVLAAKSVDYTTAPQHLQLALLN